VVHDKNSPCALVIAFTHAFGSFLFLSRIDELLPPQFCITEIRPFFSGSLLKRRGQGMWLVSVQFSFKDSCTLFLTGSVTIKIRRSAQRKIYGQNPTSSI
jgi:hypothetical protein